MHPAIRAASAWHASCHAGEKPCFISTGSQIASHFIFCANSPRQRTAALAQQKEPNQPKLRCGTQRAAIRSSRRATGG